ncbi:MAG: hypothetical protein AAFP03_08205 [Cyanobacteria bacterium J06598_3]
MANTAPDSAKQAQTGILISGIILLFLLIFGSSKQLVAQQFGSAAAGSTVETEAINIAGQHSPSVEVVAQLQYTQQALFKAELLSGSGETISEASQDFNSRSSETKKELKIDNWPNPESIKVKLTVASQSITAAPPEGITAAQVPVIFEVNVYRRWLSRSFLWPGLFACIGLWFIVNKARQKENTWE